MSSTHIAYAQYSVDMEMPKDFNWIPVRLAF